jgi:hypothetical protein
MRARQPRGHRLHLRSGHPSGVACFRPRNMAIIRLVIDGNVTPRNVVKGREPCQGGSRIL